MRCAISGLNRPISLMSGKIASVKVHFLVARFQIMFLAIFPRSLPEGGGLSEA